MPWILVKTDSVLYWKEKSKFAFKNQNNELKNQNNEFINQKMTLRI